MGVIRKFFGKKESTDDERRGATQVIMPDKVSKLVAVVRRGEKGPRSERDKAEYVWSIFKSINPLLFEYIPDRTKVSTDYIETDYINKDDFVNIDYLFDLLDDLKVPNPYSSYLQTLRFSRDRALIRLREEGNPDREHAVKLPDPYDTKHLPANVLLMIVYESKEGITASSMWPAEPRVRFLPKSKLKDYERELLERDTERFSGDK